jgi:hypothetical protein
VADKQVETSGLEGLGLDPNFVAAILAQQQNAGMDTQSLASVWGSSLDVDYPVQTKVETVPRSRPGRRGGYVPGGATKAQADEFTKRFAGTETVKTTVTTQQLLKDFTKRSRTDKEGFAALQQQLFMGGFFNPNVAMEEIQVGTLDDNTMDAWFNLLQWTARYNEAGEDTTWEEVLSERSAKLLGPLREQLARSRSGGGGGGGGNMVALADPAGLAQALNQVAIQTVGRKATPDEQRMFVATFHAMQSGAQSATSGTVITPDVQGQAEQMLRQNAPVEAQSHDVARTFDDFLDIIGGMGTT